MELRCASKKHGEMLTPGTGVLEVSCSSSFCGRRAGVTVRHQFDLRTGQLVSTHKYNTNVRSKR